jgi:hypothetical protein
VGLARWRAVRPAASFLRRASDRLPNIDVESDFSILKWELDEFRKSLLDLSLEGIFQAKQFELLDSIWCILTPILGLSQ